MKCAVKFIIFEGIKFSLDLNLLQNVYLSLKWSSLLGMQISHHYFSGVFDQRSPNMVKEDQWKEAVIQNWNDYLNDCFFIFWIRVV